MREINGHTDINRSEGASDDNHGFVLAQNGSCNEQGR